MDQYRDPEADSYAEYPIDKLVQGRFQVRLIAFLVLATLFLKHSPTLLQRSLVATQVDEIQEKIRTYGTC